MRERLVLRGLSPRLLGTYLERLGARRVKETTFVGAGWRVSLAPRRVRLGVIELDEVELAFEGEPVAVAEAVQGLRQKALRAGG